MDKRTEEAIERLIADWPPLTDEAREKLRELLATGPEVSQSRPRHTGRKVSLEDDQLPVVRSARIILEASRRGTDDPRPKPELSDLQWHLGELLQIIADLTGYEG